MKKFSVIDVLIVILLLLVIVFGFLKVKNMVSEGSSEQSVHFSVLATEVNAGTGAIISAGDQVSISLKEKAYATVIAVSETEHFEDKFNPNWKKYPSNLLILNKLMKIS